MYGNKRGGYSGGPGPSQSKKPKNDDDDEFPAETFEDHLANLDDDDMMDDWDGEVAEGEGPAMESTYAKWTRPAPPSLDPAKDSISFQQVELDHYIGKARQDMPGGESIIRFKCCAFESIFTCLQTRLGIFVAVLLCIFVESVNFLARKGPAPVVRMFGVTMEGNSVCCHVHGFHPYIYLPTPPGISKDNLATFRKALDTALIADIKNNSLGIVDAVLNCELVQKSTIYGFQGNKMSEFIKITLAVPKLIAASKRLLERGEVRVPDIASLGAAKPFEANIDFEIRFMADNKVVGCNWIELPAGVWKQREKRDFTSRCQMEVDVAWDKFVSHQPEGEWLKVAPVRILSFDIECAGRKGIFPEPEKDPVIQIANMVIKQGEKEPFIRNVFTLDTCAPIVGSTVISVPKEGEMLEKWASFVRDCDPDIITGYNINNFDLPYLLNRAKTLKVPNFSYLGRIINTPSVIKETVLQSKQMGKRENKSINIEGRVTFDLLLILIRDYKLRSYTLNAVSFHFLGEQKEDVHHSVISDLQHGNSQTRRRLAVYCLKDAYLPLRLLNKLMCVINYMEMARVTGVPLSYLQTRGQQIKVVSQLLRSVFGWFTCSLYVVLLS